PLLQHLHKPGGTPDERRGGTVQLLDGTEVSRILTEIHPLRQTTRDRSGWIPDGLPAPSAEDRGCPPASRQAAGQGGGGARRASPPPGSSARARQHPGRAARRLGNDPE